MGGCEEGRGRWRSGGSRWESQTRRQSGPARYRRDARRFGGSSFEVAIRYSCLRGLQRDIVEARAPRRSLHETAHNGRSRRPVSCFQGGRRRVLCAPLAPGHSVRRASPGGPGPERLLGTQVAASASLGSAPAVLRRVNRSAVALGHDAGHADQVHVNFEIGRRLGDKRAASTNVSHLKLIPGLSCCRPR